MSTYLHYVIEYKDKKGKWNLVKTFSSYIEKSTSYYDEEKKKWISEVIPPDITTSDIKLKKTDSFYIQGIIRDLFRNSSFSNKGFPKDISEEAKVILPEEEGYYSSYCTLEELNKERNKIKEQYDDNSKEYYKLTYLYDSIYKILSEMASKLNIETEKPIDIDKEEIEYLKEVKEDYLEDYLIVDNFISSIYYLIDNIIVDTLFPSYDDIRIIGYLC